MTVLSDIDHHRFLPTKQEVSSTGTGCHGDAQVSIVGHKDQHQEVADNHLDDVQQGLQEVAWTHHPLPGKGGGISTALTALLALAWCLLLEMYYE